MYKKPFRAKTVEENENIKDFPKDKILHILTKPHSSQSIAFIEEDDPWFIDKKYFKTKSGIVTDSVTIIQPDLKSFISHLISLGYELKK